MDLLITIIIILGFFVLIAWGANWVISTYALGRPFQLVVGVALLICLLILAAKMVQGTFPIIKLT